MTYYFESVMGNIFDCATKPAQKDNTQILVRIQSDSTKSISNVSGLWTNVANSELAPETAVVPMSASTNFSWNRLQVIYADSLQRNIGGLKIDQSMLYELREIFLTVKRNIGRMSKQFYDCAVELDKTFPTYFEECSATNKKSHITDKVLLEKIRSHTLDMINIHLIIIDSLDGLNDEEARNIMKLIAISHILLKIVPHYFTVLDMIITKFLLRMGFLHEDNAETILVYLNFITTSITNFMDLQLADDLESQHSEQLQSVVARGSPIEDLRKKVLCEDHFRETAFINESHHRLVHNAVPKHFNECRSSPPLNVLIPVKTYGASSTSSIVQKCSVVQVDEPLPPSNSPRRPSFDIVLVEEMIQPSAPTKTEETAKEQKLKRKLLLKTQKLQSQSATLRRIRKKMSLLRTPKEIIKDSVSHLNTFVQTFIFMQLYQPSRQQWSLKAQKLALCMFYKSPSFYNFMREKLHFNLPSLTTIQRWRSMPQFQTGFRSNAFLKLKDPVTYMMEREGQCVLMMDEMSTQKNLELNESWDKDM